MKKKLEGVVQKEILAYLKSKNFYTVKTMRSNMNGVPDIICCVHGFFIAIEVKAEGKKNTATKLQKRHQLDVIKAGGIALICDNVEEVKKAIEGLEDVIL